MKWIMLIGIGFIITGCCCTTTRYVQYRQVAVVPVYETVIMNDQEPLDVTTTTIDFY